MTSINPRVPLCLAWSSALCVVLVSVSLTLKDWHHQVAQFYFLTQLSSQLCSQLLSFDEVVNVDP